MSRQSSLHADPWPMAPSATECLPLRIGILTEYFYPDSTGGTGTALSHLARRLKDDHPELDLEVITSRHLYRPGDRARSGGSALPAREEWGGIQITRLASPRPDRRPVPLRLAINSVFSAATLRKLLRRPRYDLLFVSTAPPMLPMVATAFQRLTQTPFVYLVYDLYPDIAIALEVLRRDASTARLLHRLQRSWLHAASKTVVLGRCMEDHLTTRYGLSREQTEVIPVGADPDQVLPMDRQSGFRARHGLSGSVILHAGNLGRNQDFDTLLDAARLLRERRPDITFVLVGDGGQREQVRRRVEQEKISNVRIIPFVPEKELSDMLASADISLVTLEPGAVGLGVPSKFYNILASGRACVAIVAPGCEVARVLGEADCGVRVNPREPAELAAVLAGLCDAPQETARMGVNARRVLLERYTTDHVTRRFCETFAAVAAANPYSRWALEARSRAAKSMNGVHPPAPEPLERVPGGSTPACPHAPAASPYGSDAQGTVRTRALPELSD